MLSFLWCSLALPALVQCQKIISLEGSGWTLSNSNSSISVPAQLPSQAHLDLLANDIIPDPLFDLNEFALRWVAYDSWTYTSAPISGLSSNAKSTWLRFDGLDTFASISFCGSHVASTNNQFRQYWFDVTRILSNCSSSERIVSLNFGSAPKIANTIASQPGQQSWPFGIQNLFEFDNRWFIRKEQNDFGWDWGPALAPAGPWQPAYIIQLDADQVHVRNSIVDIYRKGQRNNLPPDQSQPWVVNASLDYFGQAISGASLRYVLNDMNNRTVWQGVFNDVECTNATVTGIATIPNGAVDLWWPSQLGPQNLYYMTIFLDSANGTGLASVNKRLGFRTIVLNELPISEAQLAQGIAPGNNWHFEVNGHEFYAKGSNFIPPDVFWPRVTRQRINDLFDSVIDGNQNMLRVWASGVYSPDFMYDLADEKGILLWSEFEFGDALYPTDPEFLDNVRQEAEYQVRRVNHHPSLALWAGGNELESLELGYIVKTFYPELLPKYTAEYEKLFIDTLAPVVFGNSRSITYSPSSTSNGWLSLNFSSPHPMEERYFKLEPGSIYGDDDFYNYDPAVLYDDSAYPVGRFANEFGYHSMPSVHSWRQQVSESELDFNSSVVFLRDHHYPPGGLNTSNYYNSSFGQAEMTQAVEEWYPVPNKTDPIGNFSAWCWATQIFQADLYKSQIEFYRRGSGRPERQLGSLYWQLEDIWVAPTWAGIEYDGRWKVLHYTAKDIYSNVIIAPYFNYTTGDISVWVTSDLWESIEGTATLEWCDWSGRKLDVGTRSSIDVNVGAINSTRVFKGNTNDLLSDFDLRNAVLRMQVKAAGRLPNSNQTQVFTHENWFHASPLNTARLQDPGLELSYSPATEKFEVKATKGIAAWVWLDYPPGAVLNFDNNAFWLLPGESKEVGFTVKSDSTNGAWVHGVTVQSMWDQTTP